MWIDGERVCHTIALPDPTELMSSGFRRSLDQLFGTEAHALLDLLEAEESRFYRDELADPVSTLAESAFQEVTPPRGILVHPVASVEEFRDRILEVDRRWRLDAILAVTDYLDP